MAKFHYENFTFTLAGRVWKVLFQNPTEPSTDKLLGFCNIDTATIEVDPKQSLDCVIISFYHELTHAACRNINAKDDIPEEYICDSVGEMLHEVLPQIEMKAPWLIARK